MTKIEELRLKIMDRPQAALNERVGTGDGIKRIFKLACAPVMRGSVLIQAGGEPMNEGDDFSLDYSSGKLTFIEAPEDKAAIVASYDFAAFSDEELEMLVSRASGNLALAASEALNALLSDRNRLITWTRNDTRLDFDRLRDSLKELSEKYASQGRSEASPPVIDEISWEEII